MKAFRFERLRWRWRMATLAAATFASWAVLGSVLVLFDQRAEEQSAALARAKAAPPASAALAQDVRKNKRS